jgi:hypothetical protein
MHPAFAIMLDVARIATFQPTPANTGTRRIGAESVSRPATNTPTITDRSVPVAVAPANRIPARFRWRPNFTFVSR